MEDPNWHKYNFYERRSQEIWARAHSPHLMGAILLGPKMAFHLRILSPRQDTTTSFIKLLEDSSKWLCDVAIRIIRIGSRSCNNSTSILQSFAVCQFAIQCTQACCTLCHAWAGATECQKLLQSVDLSTWNLIATWKAHSRCTADVLIRI